MVQLIVPSSEDGRKLKRFLEKKLPGAPVSFFFKALRQGKIKVDRKKPSDLNLELHEGNVVSLFLTDDQFNDFGFVMIDSKKDDKIEKKEKIDYSSIDVIYEDENILIAVKPVGVLSQKSKASDISINEMMQQYLHDKGDMDTEGFVPSFVHRLDRNTAGIMIMAKNLRSSQELSEMLKNHDLKKYYFAKVKGIADEWSRETLLQNSYRKDEINNKAEIRSYDPGLESKGWKKIELKAVLQSSDTAKDQSVIKVELLTGKSHQIRSQMAYYGHPILGDGKYDETEKKFRQQLYAGRVEFHHCPSLLGYLEGKVFEISDPFDI